MNNGNHVEYNGIKYSLPDWSSEVSKKLKKRSNRDEYSLVTFKGVGLEHYRRTYYEKIVNYRPVDVVNGSDETLPIDDSIKVVNHHDNHSNNQTPHSNNNNKNNNNNNNKNPNNNNNNNNDDNSFEFNVNNNSAIHINSDNESSSDDFDTTEDIVIRKPKAPIVFSDDDEIVFQHPLPRKKSINTA